MGDWTSLFTQFTPPPPSRYTPLPGYKAPASSPVAVAPPVAPAAPPSAFAPSGYLPMPGAGAGQATAQEALNMALAQIANARGQIPKDVALQNKRLGIAQRQDISSYDESTANRGIYESGIRPQGEHKIVREYNQHRQDIALAAARQFSDLAASEASARLGYSQSMYGLIGQEAAYGATHPLSGGGPAGTGSFLSTALSAVGTPYVWGGTDPATGGVDCSGFVYWAMNQSGLKVPRLDAEGFYKAAAPVDRRQLQPGDLIFYNYGRLAPGIADHVSIYMGNGQIVEAAGGSVHVEPISWSNVIGTGRIGTATAPTATRTAASSTTTTRTATQPVLQPARRAM